MPVRAPVTMATFWDAGMSVFLQVGVGWWSFYRNDSRPVGPNGDLSHPPPPGRLFHRIPASRARARRCRIHRHFRKGPYLVFPITDSPHIATALRHGGGT